MACLALELSAPLQASLHLNLKAWGVESGTKRVGGLRDLVVK